MPAARRTSTGFDLKTATGVVSSSDVVDAAARAKKVRPKTVTQAAADGSTRELLVALRARIATSVQDPSTPARDLAALTRRLQDIVREIEAIDQREKQDALEQGAAEVDESFDPEAV